MNINALYTDFWEILGNYLSSDDIYSFALTCKQAWRACNRASLKKKMSFPMSYPYRLTYDQRETIRNMEKGNHRFKLIKGAVGAGKTIVSLSYVIRNYLENPDAKIVMVGPPSLVQMWWNTLRKYFGVEPCVLHGTNPKYNSKTSWNKIPDEKFILISYILLGSHGNLGWFDNTRDVLIIDEAHHRTGAPLDQFKEVIGLSATSTDQKGLTRGIRAVEKQLDINHKDYVYILESDVIAKKLPDVRYIPLMLKPDQTTIQACKNKIRFDKLNTYDMKMIGVICKNLSHPVIEDLKDTFTPGYLMVGRKSFRVEEGDYIKRSMVIEQIRKEHPNIPHNQFKKELEKRATFNIMKTHYPKYAQAYHIIKQANDKGEKVVLFDTSVTHLPFLHKYLTGHGINSYIFSTHYDTTGRQRQLSKFKEDKNPGVLMSSIGMLGEGQNVTEANHVIFFTQCLDSKKYYQAIGRCRRYPQKKVVNVYLLFGSMYDRKVYEDACGAADMSGLDWFNLLDN